MKKGYLVAVVVTFLLVIGVMVGYYFLYLEGGVGGGVTENPSAGFPNLPTNGNQSGGQGLSGNTPPTSNQTNQEPGTPVPRLRQISSEPVAGFTAVASKPGDSIIRYVERATGHIFEARTGALGVSRISNTTIPKIYEALWAENGTATILRYLKDDDNTIDSYYAKLVLAPKSNATSQMSGGSSGASGSADTSSGGASAMLQGVFLQKNISTIAVAPGGAKIFYLSSATDGVSGIISNPDGSKKSQIWSSPLHEWLADFVDDSTIALTTKPSATSYGFLYLLNTKNGGMTKAVGGYLGLTGLVSADKKSVLYSGISNGAAFTKIRSLTKNTDTPLGVTTLPEKCVWSVKKVSTIYCAVPRIMQSGAYPESWYQGLVSFEDDIWSIDSVTGETNLILGGPEQAGNSFDVIKPSLSPDGEFLLFMNKNDLTFWVLRLAN